MLSERSSMADVSESAELPSLTPSVSDCCAVVPENHELKQGMLQKRSRHKNSWQLRMVTIDMTAGTLCYYGPKTHLRRAAASFSRTISLGKISAAEKENQAKRVLPIANLHACVIGSIDESEEDGTKILTISYSESLGSTPGSRDVTRSIFFKSAKDDPDEADEDVAEWLSMFHQAQGAKKGKSPSLAVAGEGESEDENKEDEVAEEDALPLVHCGWIRKKGSQLASKWLKRWLFFDLSMERLRYYKGPTEAIGQGEIDLQKIDVVKKGMPDLFPETNPPFTFTVVCKDRSYWMRTDSAEQTDEWVAILSTYIATRHLMRLPGVPPMRATSRSFSNCKNSDGTETRRMTFGARATSGIAM